MNCKQGDLAIVIHGGSSGMLVRCVASLPAGFDSSPPWNGPRWRVDRWLDSYTGMEKNGRKMDHLPDSFLMPIRPPGEDEHEDCDEPVTIDAER